MENQGNVLSFNKKSNYALFNENMRKRIGSHMASNTEMDRDTAEKAIDGVENAICYVLIATVRKVFENLGQRAGNAVKNSVSQ